MMKKLLFILSITMSLSLAAQVETVTIDWSFGSNPTASGNANTNRTIEVGDTVEWNWYASGTHNVASTGGTETFNSGAPTSTPGVNFSHTFTSVGTTDFVCQPHSTNMFGTITVVSEGTLGVQQFETPTKFSIFPNPGNNEMNINIPTLSDELQLEVFDLLGKRVYSEYLNGLNTKLNISKWKSGMYLVRLTSNNQDIKLTKRFVKL
ncbi:putative secreted protein (Por secretion system target) [Lacinutrix venerupis]|uniref:T9SS type A sorting domain-containing protein n=1 Tax=Lacinutrix venerupis TaxID=1486034 RepID=UPI000EABF7A3|nr:T9SS type A sorting domain-containing protein [Lacinutrix venerupis]RLJ62497.1 putative secreted protein (Por secretion system target) [Lacinutrix venerupis]